MILLLKQDNSDKFEGNLSKRDILFLSHDNLINLDGKLSNEII